MEKQGGKRQNRNSGAEEPQMSVAGGAGQGWCIWLMGGGRKLRPKIFGLGLKAERVGTNRVRLEAADEAKGQWRPEERWEAGANSS